MATFAQQVFDSGTVASGTAVTTGLATTQGNTLILVIRNLSSGNVTSVADSKGNTYSVNVKTTAGTTNIAIASARLATALTASDTVTVTSTTNFNAQAYEFSGISVFDKSVSATGSAITSLASGSTATLSNANELVVTGVGNSTGETYTPPAGYTEELPPTTTAIDMAFKNVTATTAVSATWSWNNSAAGAVAIATFVNNLAINKNETTTVTDSVDVARDGTRDVNKSESTTVTENIVKALTPLYVNVSDTTLVQDSNPMRIANYFQELSYITENIGIQIVGFNKDRTTVTDSTSRYSDLIATREEYKLLSTGFVTVSDSSTVTDSTGITVSDPLINVSNSSAVTENIKVAADLIIDREPANYQDGKGVVIV